MMFLALPWSIALDAGGLNGMHVLVIGASRGIGYEFVRQYRAEGHAVTATARDDAGLQRLRDLGAHAFALDVADAASAAGLGWRIDGSEFDICLFCAGVYGPSTAGLESPAEADFDAVMHTNVLGAMRVLAQLGDALALNARVAVLSSGMGSIGERTNSDGWLYRASKAALNSVLKDASIALSGRAVCVAIDPGWVRTDMGGPAAPTEVSQSVSDMQRTLARLTAADNGSFLKRDGRAHAW
jgi:NAD(P)-dependent dehydrogenase (short-subunit alcohol dehydrogenase family)